MLSIAPIIFLSKIIREDTSKISSIKLKKIKKKIAETTVPIVRYKPFFLFILNLLLIKLKNFINRLLLSGCKKVP
jgi:hypothetical protein